MGRPYWHLSGAEAKGVVAAKSILAHESLETLQNFAAKNKGIVTFPDVWTNFDAGAVGRAKGARQFSIKWHQNAVLPEEEDILYMSEE